jgi:hypothetical protein
MVQFEYFPALIDAHRNDLRALAQPLPSEIASTPWRRAIGLRLVQLGRWLEGNRPAIAGEPPVPAGASPTA